MRPSQIEREVTEFFAGMNGVEILFDVLKHPKPHAELSSLALQYFLHIAADHAEFLDGAMKTYFETSILPQLVGNELTKELLVETYHRYEWTRYVCKGSSIFDTESFFPLQSSRGAFLRIRPCGEGV